MTSGRQPSAAGPPVRIRIRFAGELRFLLRSTHRRDEIAYRHDGTSSLGHVVESLGVPLTEVGGLHIAGRDVLPAHTPHDGEVVFVRPVKRPQALPADVSGPLRFLLDVHLGALARRLRLVGVDAAYRNDNDDDTLLARANAQQRVLLTRDRGLLRRHALWLGAYVRGSRGDDQLVDVLERFAPPLAPWTRCPACNGTTVPVRKEEIADRLPPGTRRTHHTFRRCAECARLYWPGAHHTRLQRTVDAAMAAVTAAPRRCPSPPTG